MTETGVLGRAQAWLCRVVSGPRIVAVGLAVILIDFLILGPWSFYQEHDNGDAIYPTVAALVPDFPDPGYFYPYGMAGTDRLATGHHGGLELALYWLLPDWLGLTLLTVLLAVIPAVFTYKITRRCFGADPIWAGLAGVTAAMLTGEGQLFNFSLALVPPTLWYLYRIAQAPKGSYGAYLGLALTTIFHGVTGHIHFLSVAIAPMVTVWLGVVFPTRRLSAIGAAILAVVVPILMRWQDFAAAALNGPLSHRAHQTRDMPPEGWDEIWGLISKPGDLPVFVFLLVLGAGLVWALSRRSADGPNVWPVLRLLTVCVFMQATLLIVPAIKPMVNIILPLFEGFQLSRVWVGTPMLWAMALGAVSVFLPVADHRRAPMIGVSLTLAFLIVTIGTQKAQHADAYLRTGSFTYAFQSKTLQALATRIDQADGGPWRAEPIRVEATRLQSYGIETLGGYFTLYPKRYHDYWVRLIDPLRQTSPDAYASMERLGSEAFLFATRHDPAPALADFADIDLLSLGNVRYLLTKNPLSEDWLIPLRSRDVPWDSLGLTGRIWENLKGNFTGYGDYYLYENPRAVRRFFRPDGLDRLADDAAVLEALSTRPLDELLHAAPVMHTAFSTYDEIPKTDDAQDSVGDITRGVDTYWVEVNYDQPGILAGSVSFSPYWTASFLPTQGAAIPLKVEPIYHAFTGVTVPAGPGTVRFFYDPPYGFSAPPDKP